MTDRKGYLIDMDGVVYRGTINAGAFTATGTIPTINFDGIACKSFSITYKGTMVGANLSGSLSGRFTCVFEGRSLEFLEQGTFTVNRTTRAKAGGASRRNWTEENIAAGMQ